MDFYAVLDQVLALLRQRGRVSYRALKRQFDLDDAYLDDLKVEIIEVHQCAVDQEGTMLVWMGKAASAATPEPVQAPAPLTYTPPYLAEKIFTSRSALEGERKQVTVLFADLKGSLELILADRDPEEARQLLDPVLERMMAAVHRYEGTVNQVMGDGIMALFGAPIAHEDHAVRACYAALAMQEAVHHYAAEVQRSHGVPLQMRVGLHAGEVVVRAISNDLHLDYSAIGQTTHMAARMEQMAMPGSTLITPAVLGLAQGYVQVRALGPVLVKGLDAPLEVYELVGASGIQGRLQAAEARGLTRFVGRDTEVTTLIQALEQAGASHGQVVAVVGEAGVGKSRLVYECLHSHHTQGWRVLESASVSYGKATPYAPVMDLLKRYAHVEAHDDPRTVRAKVTGLILTLDDPRRLGQVSIFQASYFYLRDAYDQAITVSQRGLVLAAASGDVELHALANRYLGIAYHAQGNYRQAIDCLGQTAAFFDRTRPRTRFDDVSLSAVLSHAQLAMSHAELGTFAEGRALGDAGLRIAEAVAHPGSLMFAYYGVGLLSLRQGDLPGALSQLEQAMGIWQDADLPMYFPRMAAALGAAYTLAGRITPAVSLLTPALRQSVVMARAHFETLCSLSLGEAHLRAGRLEEAHALAERMLALAREHGERGHQAYALRLLGDIAAQHDPPQIESAAAHYRQALALADELGMRPLVAHCHLGLGMLYLKTIRGEQARPELSAAIALYRAMDMAFWLPQAEAALALAEHAFHRGDSIRP